MQHINVTYTKAVTFFPASTVNKIFFTMYETSELLGYIILLSGRSWNKLLFNLLIQSSDLFHWLALIKSSCLIQWAPLLHCWCSCKSCFVIFCIWAFVTDYNASRVLFLGAELELFLHIDFHLTVQHKQLKNLSINYLNPVATVATFTGPCKIIFPLMTENAKLFFSWGHVPNLLIECDHHSHCHALSSCRDVIWDTKKILIVGINLGP